MEEYDSFLMEITLIKVDATNETRWSWYLPRSDAQRMKNASSPSILARNVQPKCNYTGVLDKLPIGNTL